MGAKCSSTCLTPSSDSALAVSIGCAVANEPLVTTGVPRHARAARGAAPARQTSSSSVGIIVWERRAIIVVSTFVVEWWPSGGGGAWLAEDGGSGTR